MGKGGHKVQTFSCKVSHGNVMYSMMNIVNNVISNIWKFLRVNLKSSHHKKIFLLQYMVMDIS